MYLLLMFCCRKLSYALKVINKTKDKVQQPARKWNHSYYGGMERLFKQRR